MANEYTLLDYERTAPDNLNKAIARTWREASPIMELLRFKLNPALSQKILRYNSLNAPTWRNIGEAFQQSKIEPTPIEERLHFMGGKIEVPYEYVKAPSLNGDPRAIQTEAQMKSAAFGFNDAFFNGDPTSDPKTLVGMWYRIKNDLGSGQYFDANLDVSDDTAVTTWYHKMFDRVDRLISLVDGQPSQKVLFCGDTMFRRINSALRQANMNFTAELAGKQYLTYGMGGPKIVNVGYKYDQSTQILGTAENGITALSGGSDSSLYCVAFGDPYVMGWSQELPNADDVGLTEDRVNYLTVVRASFGIFMTSPRSAALAYGWTAADS